MKHGGAILVAAALAACTPRAADEGLSTREGPCVSCHAEESRAWASSMHYTSFSSEDFRASYAEEPLPFCADCHAPRAKDLGEAVGREHGIDCESCHPGAERHAKGDASARPTTTPCARCHELTSEGSGTFLQSTATEHAASASRDVPCTSCHMPRTASGRRDHRFSVSRDPAFLSRAIAIGEVGVGPSGATFSLVARGVGHKLPTGDIFRELFVRAWVETTEGAIVGETEASLHRDWDAHRAAFGKSRVPDPLGDTRLDATPRLFTVAVAGRASVLRVTVDYRRGFEARGGHLATFATLRILDETRPLPAR